MFDISAVCFSILRPLRYLYYCCHFLLSPVLSVTGIFHGCPTIAHMIFGSGHLALRVTFSSLKQ